MSKAAPYDAGDYGSEFDSESDSERKSKKKRREEEVPRKKHKKHEVASKDVLKDEYEKGESEDHVIMYGWSEAALDISYPFPPRLSLSPFLS